MRWLDSHVQSQISVYGSIEDRLKKIQQQVAEACQQSRRRVEDITIIGVSKYHPAEAAAAACQFGIGDLGENQALALRDKANRLADWGYSPSWHLIGTLQTNKVKYVLGRAAYIHSVDRLSLLTEIQKRAQKLAIRQKIFLQVNWSNVPNKHGFSQRDLEALLMSWPQYGLTHVEVCGLMTMAEPHWSRDHLETFFGDFQMYHQTVVKPALNDLNQPGTYLSMGMSQDFEIAIRFGATHVRIGTGIFGKPQVNP